MTYGEQFRATLKAEGLTVEDCVRLSALWYKGELTESKLRRHSNETCQLGPEDRMALNRLIADHRMVMGKVKWVVFEAIGSKVGKA